MKAALSGIIIDKHNINIKNASKFNQTSSSGSCKLTVVPLSISL